jgi:hypothetical protein
VARGLKPDPIRWAKCPDLNWVKRYSLSLILSTKPSKQSHSLGRIFRVAAILPVDVYAVLYGYSDART